MDKNVEEYIIERLSDMCGNEYEDLYTLGDGRFRLCVREHGDGDVCPEEEMESIVSEIWMDVMERFGTETTWDPLSDVSELVYDRVKYGNSASSSQQ